MGLLKKLWVKYNPFDLHVWCDRLSQELDKVKHHIDVKTNNVKASIETLEQKLNNDIETLEAEVRFHKSFIKVLGETIPDMLWLKDIDGIYLYANKAIRQNLLFDDNPIGKNDVELSLAAKKRFGDPNYTLGTVCENSDQVVIDLVLSGQWGKEPNQGRFYEYGKIKGKMMYLEVNKAPMYIEGVFIGVCGAGRDLTPYVEAYKLRGCNICPTTDQEDIFKLFEFKNEEG